MTANIQSVTKAIANPGQKRQAKTASSPANASKPIQKVPSKTDALVAMLSRDTGATIADMMSASGWMAHSVRGFMAGALRKRLGHMVSSEMTGAGRVYRIVTAK